MGWTKKVEREHLCRTPGMLYDRDFGEMEVAPGSIWECEDCGTQWQYDGRNKFSEVKKTELLKEDN